MISDHAIPDSCWWNTYSKFWVLEWEFWGFFPSEYSSCLELTRQIITHYNLYINISGSFDFEYYFNKLFSSCFSKELLVRKGRSSKNSLLERIWTCIPLLRAGIDFPFADTNSAERCAGGKGNFLNLPCHLCCRMTFWVAAKGHFGLLEEKILEYYRRTFWIAVEYFGLQQKDTLEYCRRTFCIAAEHFGFLQIFFDCCRRTLWIAVEEHFGLQQKDILDCWRRTFWIFAELFWYLQNILDCCRRTFWSAAGRISGAWDPVSASHSSKYQKSWLIPCAKQAAPGGCCTPWMRSFPQIELSEASAEAWASKRSVCCYY